MQRVTQFAFRVSEDERQAIANLAVRLQRSQSDAVRFVVIEAARQLSYTNPNPALSMPANEIKKEGLNVTE